VSKTPTHHPLESGWRRKSHVYRAQSMGAQGRSGSWPHSTLTWVRDATPRCEEWHRGGDAWGWAWRWWGLLIGWWLLRKTGGGGGRQLVWIVLVGCTVGVEAAGEECGGAFVWNAMGLAVSVNAKKFFFSEVARQKLAALFTYLRTRRPAVGALIELGGSRKALSHLRKWLKNVGYEMEYLTGGRDEETNSIVNGVAVLFRKGTVRKAGSGVDVQAIAPRTLRVKLRWMEGAAWDVIAWHGLSEQ